MATIEFIDKRIAGKEKEIATLEKKLARINKAAESNYKENNPYYYGPSDLRQATRDLESARSALEKYQLQLEEEFSKANSRDIQIILDFLADWKAKVYDTYSKGLVKYYKDYDRVQNMLRNLKHEWEVSTPEERAAARQAEAEYKAAKAEFNIKCKGRFEEIPKDDPAYRYWAHTRKVEIGEYEWLKDWTNFGALQPALDNLDKVLTHEAELKYDDLVNRVCSIVGTILDASFLTIGPKGDLNGYIVGDKGNVHVQTIGAGGYNEGIIVNEKHGQCYHFRTLIKPVKTVPNSLVTL